MNNHATTVDYIAITIFRKLQRSKIITRIDLTLLDRKTGMIAPLEFHSSIYVDHFGMLWSALCLWSAFYVLYAFSRFDSLDISP